MKNKTCELEEKAIEGLKALRRIIHRNKFESRMALSDQENRREIRHMRWLTYTPDYGVQDETRNDPVYRKLDVHFGDYEIFLERKKAMETIEQRKMGKEEYESLLNGTHKILGKYMKRTNVCEKVPNRLLKSIYRFFTRAPSKLEW